MTYRRFVPSHIQIHKRKAAYSGIYKDLQYLADPHGAVGYLALRDFLQAHPGQRNFWNGTRLNSLTLWNRIIDHYNRPARSLKQIMNKEETAVECRQKQLKLKEFFAGYELTSQL